MKAERIYTTLWAALLAFLIGFGAALCLASGMKLPGISLGSLALCCTIISMVCAVAVSLRFVLPLLGAAALLGGYFWNQGALRTASYAVLEHISFLYHQGYGWGYLDFADIQPNSPDTLPFLCLLAFLISMTVTVTVQRRYHVWGAACIGLLPLGACLILTDTVPEEIGLFFLLSGLVLLLITQDVRRKNNAQGNTLTAMTVLPVLLASLCLFLFVPQKGYHGQDYLALIEEYFTQLVQESTGGVIRVQGDTPASISLRTTGPRLDLSSVVMEVTAQETGPLYLRGCAYDYYDGTAWDSQQGAGSWDMDFKGIGQEKALSISTKQPHSVLYFTYAPTELPRVVVDGKMKNGDNLTQYTVSYREPVSYNTLWDALDATIPDAALAERYLALPEETRRSATEFLKTRVGFPTSTENAGQTWKNANIIADYVRQSAAYDLDTPTMPLSETDFAMWFLRSSDTGYCVHYATATVVLLRAAGIPARYVSGYLVSAKAGVSVPVRMRQAHAWAECYINGYGWVVLESTPSTGTSPVPETQATQETTAVTTEETTVPQDIPAQQLPPDETLQPAQDPSAPSPSRDITAVVVVLISLSAIAAVLVQWQLRLQLRKKKQLRSRANQQALARWQELVLLWKLLEQDPAVELLAIAQEARFSLHTVTPDQLKQMDAAQRTARQQLKQHPFYKRLWYRLVYALW